MISMAFRTVSSCMLVRQLPCALLQTGSSPMNCKVHLHSLPRCGLRISLSSKKWQSTVDSIFKWRVSMQESVVCVSSGADSPLTPASYTESMRSPFSRSGRPSGGFRTSGSAFRAGSRDSLASLSSAEAQREDQVQPYLAPPRPLPSRLPPPIEAPRSRPAQGAGIDPHAAAVELECMGSWSDCPDAVRTSRPFLQGCLALRVPPSVAPRVLRGILKGQVAVSACDSSGRLARCTGVQTAGAIDALFPYDGSLGAFVDRSAGTVTISVWAPTAQSVQLTLFREPRGDAFLTVPMQPGAMGAWHAR